VKDHLLQIVSSVRPEDRRNLAREYLQVYLLRLLQETHATDRMAFVGGTALRLLYRLPRFSEDLDFSLIPAPRAATAFDPAEVFAKVKLSLEKSGYAVSARVRSEKTVASVFFRFAGLARDIGWSPDPRALVSVKLEIDTNPPAGAHLEQSPIVRFFPIAIRHYDPESLFAGKIHALLCRSYPKGRDWFDLVWYLAEHPGIEPNTELLANALEQTGMDRALAKRWRQALRGRLAQIDWDAAMRDLRPFVERTGDMQMLTKELVRHQLRG